MSPPQTVAVAVLTRDLRVHDNPVLSSAAAAADTVVPLFVLDDAILRSGFNRPNRAAFLVDCLRDLDASLTDRGAGLVVRRGDWVAEVVRVVAETGAGVVHVAGDVTRYAGGRVDRLRAALGGAGVELVVHDAALFVVPPGDLAPRRQGPHGGLHAVLPALGARAHPRPGADAPGPAAAGGAGARPGAARQPTSRRGRRRRRSRPAARRRGGAG